MDCQNYYGYHKWFAGHRNGAPGLANANTVDINSTWNLRRSSDLMIDLNSTAYESAVQWIQQQIDSNSTYK